MRRFQFSLLGLFGLMTCAALGCAALVQASAMWCSAVAACVVVVLLTAILGIVLRPWPRKAFWIGFTVFGWGYIVLTFGSLVSIRNPSVSPIVGIDSGNSILDAPLSWLYDVIHGAHSSGYQPYPSTAPVLVPALPSVSVTPPTFIAPVDASGAAPSATSVPVPSDSLPQPLQPPFPSSSAGNPPTLAPPSPSVAPSDNMPPATSIPLWDPYATTPTLRFIDPFALAHFKTTGNLLAAMLLGMVGGIIARAFYVARERDARTTASGATEPADSDPIVNSSKER